MTALHYADQVFELTDDEDPAELAAKIESKVRERGGWVDFATAEGAISVLVSAGVPVWVDRRVLAGVNVERTVL
jgi:hypothetical protein